MAYGYRWEIGCLGQQVWAGTFEYWRLWSGSIKCHRFGDTTALFEHVTGLGFLFLPPKKLEMHNVAPEFKFGKHFLFIKTNNEDFAMVNLPFFSGKRGWAQTMGEETPSKFFVINFEATLLSLLMRFWRKAILEGCHLPSPEPQFCGDVLDRGLALGYFWGRCRAGCWTNVLLMAGRSQV